MIESHTHTHAHASQMNVIIKSVNHKISHRKEAALVSAVRAFWEEAAGTSAFGSENKHKSIINNHTQKLTAYWKSSISGLSKAEVVRKLRSGFLQVL